MATNKIELLYDLVQNSSENSRSYGLWYPGAIRHSTLDLDGLTDHIAGHDSIYTPDVVKGVLTLRLPEGRAHTLPARRQRPR